MELSKIHVKEWLEDRAGPRPTKAVSGPTGDEGGDNTHGGFLTDLFYACLNTASVLRLDTGPRRRRIGRNVHQKLTLLADAFEGGKLESCLSIDEELYEKILDLLYKAGRVISKICEGLHSIRKDLKRNHTELKQHLDQAKQILAATTSDSDWSSSSDDGAHAKDCSVGDSFKGAHQASLNTYVDLLMDLCPILEQTYRDQHRARPPHLLSIPAFKVTHAAMPYVQLVRDKFPLADQLLVERLGEANWQRHEQMRSVKEVPNSVDLTSVLPNTAKSQFQPVTLFKDSALGSSIAPLSQRAESVVSHSSFVSSNQETEKSHFQVPKLPKDAVYGEPFSCPFCDTTLNSIKNRIEWKLHVFADLQAYICLDADCSDMLKLFPSRKSWFEHESSQHLSFHQFHCQLCDLVPGNETDLLSHAMTHHDIDISNPQMKTAVLSAARKSILKDPANLQCRLCRRKNFCVTHRDYATHVGRELEEVALSALPPQEDEDQEDELSSNSEGDEHNPGGESSGKVDVDGTQRRIDDIVSQSRNPSNDPTADDIPTNLQPADEYAFTMPEIPTSFFPSAVPNTKGSSTATPRAATDQSASNLTASTSPVNATSYWSLPEQQAFPELVGYYGRDFAAIAEHMKNKTVTMIKNHYNRQLLDGRLDLEHLVKAAESRKATGTPRGPPPVPISSTRRRYEAMPVPDRPTGPSLSEQAVPKYDPGPHSGNFGDGQNFNLDFRILEKDEILGNFDFDKYLKTTVCSCGQENSQEMVRCSNPDCKHQDFHLECAGLFTMPKSKDEAWYCKGCLLSLPDTSRNLQEEEDFIIKCICGYIDDDGNTVYCPKCDTWQHTQCYYPSVEVPDGHYCVKCVFRDNLDAKGAHERQMKYRAALDGADRKLKRPPSTRSKKKKNQDSVSAADEMNEPHPGRKRRYERRSASPSSGPVDHLETSAANIIPSPQSNRQAPENRGRQSSVEYEEERIRRYLERQGLRGYDLERQVKAETAAAYPARVTRKPRLRKAQFSESDSEDISQPRNRAYTPDLDSNEERRLGPYPRLWRDPKSGKLVTRDPMIPDDNNDHNGSKRVQPDPSVDTPGESPGSPKKYIAMSPEAIVERQSQDKRTLHDPPTSAEWERYKPIITKLYMTHKLKEVQDILKTQHGFRATKGMYKARFMQWHVCMNYTRSQKAPIPRKLRYEQQASGLPSTPHIPSAPDIEHTVQNSYITDAQEASKTVPSARQDSDPSHLSPEEGARIEHPESPKEEVRRDEQDANLLTPGMGHSSDTPDDAEPPFSNPATANTTLFPADFAHLDNHPIFDEGFMEDESSFVGFDAMQN